MKMCSSETMLKLFMHMCVCVFLCVCIDEAMNSREDHDMDTGEVEEREMKMCYTHVRNHYIF